MKSVKKIAVILIIFLFTDQLFAQNTAAISGKVTDERFNALKAVTVHLLNTNLSVLTNAQGEYIINDIHKGKYIISFSSIGYASQNKKVYVSSATNNIDVQLADATAQLDDVVVTAEKKEESVQK
ncbi:MAG: carboxypeptidase-like regulatory domain-containing protein, partial [Parafilimonas sp.]